MGDPVVYFEVLGEDAEALQGCRSGFEGKESHDAKGL
jgi:hypothetical protein